MSAVAGHLAIDTGQDTGNAPLMVSRERRGMLFVQLVSRSCSGSPQYPQSMLFLVTFNPSV